MDTLQKFGVLDEHIIDKLIKEYELSGEYDTPTMNKASPEFVIEWLTPVLENIIGKQLTYCSGNFYKHSIPYLPHTDYKTYQSNTLNIVMPLEYAGEQASLVIFDQEWHQDSVTWCMHKTVQYFSTNIGVKGCPREYPVTNLTSREIDNRLYINYLNHYPKHTLFGLSGVAYPFVPGSIILFDNRRIHCTSAFDGIKTGLSLRFSVT
jgi:hypothetical protein